ncbi:MAG: hypothetical protein AB2L24_26625 [Mangrovibacterium sp.]
MMVEPWNIKDGVLTISQNPGLGVVLTKEIEKEFRFREDAVYTCVPSQSSKISDDVWKI